MRNPLAILAILIVSVPSGCMYNNPYPYGYYGGGGSYYGPGYYGTPQPTPMYPGGNVPSNIQPTPIDGGTYTPGGTTPGNSPTLGDPPNTYNENTPTFRENPTPSDKTVPDPGDDSTGSNEPTLRPINAARQKEGLDSPFQQDDSTRLPRDFEEPVAEAETEAEPVYQAPLRQASSLEEPETIQQANREELPPDTTNRFGHHPRFEWLRGIVEYDQQQECWVMMYDDDPDHSDKLGGVVTLAGHPALKRLQDGQTVRIEGTIDRTETDASGKPVYRITKLIKP